jgi:hypothetical protein
MNNPITIIPEEESVYSGTYSLHWEVPCLRIKTGKKFLGLLPISESWLVTFPKNFIWPDDNIKPENLISMKSAYQYHLVAKGTPSKKGQFAHMGICNRLFNVSEVIELIKI